MQIGYNVHCKLLLIIGLAIGLALSACEPAVENVGQPVPVSADFPKLLQRFHRLGQGRTLLPPPVIYRDSIPAYSGAKAKIQYKIRLASRPVGFHHQVVKLHGRGYPVSYSVLYQSDLVALFKDGSLGCFRLTDFGHDHVLERQLNTRRWQRHWIVNHELIALSKGHHYVFDSVHRAWQPYRQPVPFGLRPKLFEDSRYLVYSDCQGEWGGTVYFFNKASRQTRRANAACAVDVWQEKGKYQLLASLNSTAQAVIVDPEILPLASAAKNERINWQYDFDLPEKGVVPVFDYYGIKSFGGFRWQGETVYIMCWLDTTFLATIAHDQMTIIDPLFADGLFTHDPITTSYGPALALTNLDFYGLGGSDEVATLLWQGKQLTKVEWGEQPQDTDY
jgi:hypothetical protein